VLYYHVIYECKVGLPFVILYYKACPVSVLKLIKLFCIFTIAILTIQKHFNSFINFNTDNEYIL
jgi:hypothetical protein